MREIAIVAQTTAPGGAAAPAPATRATQDAPFWTSPMMPVFLLIILLYVFMFRTKKGEQSKRQEMIKSMKKGDEVQTIGGEFGRVMDIKDDRVLIKVDESSNTKIWYSRSSIHRVMGEEKAEAK